MLKADIPVDHKYLIGDGLDIGAGWNPLEESLSIDTVVRGEYFVPGCEPSKAVWRADASALPLKDSICDYIFCSHFLEHVEDRLQEILTEFARVLHIGGYLVAITPDITYCRLPGDIAHGIIPGSLSAPLAVAGFEIVQIDTLHNAFTFDLVARRI